MPSLILHGFLLGEPLPAEIIQFDEFELDLDRYELRRSDRVVKLEKSPMELLILLLENQGRLVTREEIIQRLWGDNVFVDTRHGINTAVHKLRSALRDDSEKPRILETVVGKGYRLIAATVPRSHESTAGVTEIVEPNPNLGNNGNAVSGVIVDAGAAPHNDGSGKSRKKKPFVWAVIASVALVSGVLSALWLIPLMRNRISEGGVGKNIHSVAVLPLENLSRDPEQEYFADGMTDELTTDLAQLSKMRVISRTSAMRYKGRKEPVTTIARALGVDAVIEGTVEREGNQVRIRAQLIDAVRDQHLWARSYDRELLNILQLQDEVAHDIAQEISESLASPAGEHLPQRSIDIQAYDDYLRGKYYAHRLAKEDVAKGAEYLERATQRDPTFAPAFAELGFAYLTMPNLGGPMDWIPPMEPFSKAKVAAEHALALDPNLADAHAVLGTVYQDYDWDWLTGDKHLRRAVELNPNSSFAHLMYASSLGYTGHGAASVDEMDRALSLDPLSSTQRFVSTFILIHAHHYDQAVQVAERAVREDPKSTSSHLALTSALGMAGRGQEAFAEWLRYLQVSGNGELAGQLASAAQTASGTDDPGRKLALITLRYLRNRSKTQYVSPAAFVEVYTELGDNDNSLKWLEKAYQEHSPIMYALKVDPMFDPLRGERRFQQLQSRMHFPQ